MHDRVPAETAPKCTPSAGVETDMVNTEKTSAVMVHIDEMIGERGLFVEVHKGTISGVMNLTVFPITDTRDMA
jgi:hypothetical protein